MVMQATTLMRVMLIVLAAMSAAGCELVGGIFKAGIWVGAIGVILVVVLLVVGVGKVQGLTVPLCFEGRDRMLPLKPDGSTRHRPFLKFCAARSTC